MIIAVVAGTTVDTRMGVDILEKEGYQALYYPMAETPQDQTQLQYFSQEALDQSFQDKVRHAKGRGAQAVFVYCNSLSTVLNYKEAEDKLGLPIITPLETYKELPGELKSIVILAANGISAFKIDRIVQAYQPDMKTLTVGNLSIVESIEKKKPSRAIVEDLNLKAFLSYLEGIGEAPYRVDAVLLACTHFPYIKEVLQKETRIPIIDPKEDMLRRLKEALPSDK